jgi:hypothetical protein
MVKLMGFIGGLVASLVTGYLTSSFGMVTAFLLSTIAGGFGMYYGAKWARNNFT